MRDVLNERPLTIKLLPVKFNVNEVDVRYFLCVTCSPLTRTNMYWVAGERPKKPTLHVNPRRHMSENTPFIRCLRGENLNFMHVSTLES